MKYKVVRAVRYLESLIGDETRIEKGYSVSQSRFGFLWEPIKVNRKRIFFMSPSGAFSALYALMWKTFPLDKEECKPTS